MIRLLRTEKQHSPGPGTTRGQGTGSLKGLLLAPPVFLSWAGGSSRTSCSLQGSAQEHQSQVKRSNRTSRGVTRAQTAQVLLTKEKSPGLGIFTRHELCKGLKGLSLKIRQENVQVVGPAGLQGRQLQMKSRRLLCRAASFICTPPLRTAHCTPIGVNYEPREALHTASSIRKTNPQFKDCKVSNALQVRTPWLQH